ncbi:MAG TPA: FAD:protein FMN transferase [Ilumatobacteraceae bacterium]|nr:FAD:protein FMN transferase [Ilumatobacteraceae bacterium]
MEAAEHRFRVMASDVHVIVVGAPDGLVADARTHLEHLEQRWSRFLPDSDVTRVNTAPGRPVEVDADTLTLFDTMISAWQLTGGQYDPTVLPALIGAGYGASIEDPRRVTSVPPGELRLGGMAGVDIDCNRRTINVPPGVVVDPGGIGKGLAADLTVARLLAAGARGALVSIGGDMAMAGTPPSADGWLVNVEHPDAANGDLCTLTVSGGGVATSSTRSRTWCHDGRPRHHLIDPTSAAQSTTDLAAVTVIARSGWLAEAHATAALLSGTARVLEYLDRHDLTGLAIPLTGSPLVTSDLEGVSLRLAAGAP